MTILVNELIASTGISQSGSIMWEIINVDPVEQIWIERKTISDKIIEFFKSAR